MNKFPVMLLKMAIALVMTLVLLLLGAILFVPGIHISSIQMALNVMTGRGGDTPEDTLLARLQVPDGYHVSIFARGISNPRFLHRTSAGRLLVSSPRSGEILQLSDSDGDGFADQQEALLSGLQRPHGLDIYNGHLYVAESNQVGRVPYDEATGTLTGSYQAIITGLTDNGNHWSKSIRFSPGGKLFLALGSTCNVCLEEDERRAAIMRFEADGSGGKIFATGLRNSVGLAFAPWDNSLYATDNGRDLLGDDYPPCELNQIEEGGFYGWPYYHGSNEPDPDFDARGTSLEKQAIAPAFPFPAHNAPLGIHFPAGVGRTALVALHGSWNRSIPDGYKVVRLSWADDGTIGAEDFMWGFERDGDIVGRPVDITDDSEDGFFISDDYARVIYRVSPIVHAAAAAAPTVEVAKTTRHIELDPRLVATGEAVYGEFPCAECHGSDAMTPILLKGLDGKYTLDSLRDYFLTPTPPMPNFELSAEQREALAHYLFSQQ